LDEEDGLEVGLEESNADVAQESAVSPGRSDEENDMGNLGVAGGKTGRMGRGRFFRKKISPLCSELGSRARGTDIQEERSDHGTARGDKRYRCEVGPVYPSGVMSSA